MELQIYTTEDFPAMSRQGSPTIRFNAKSGVITISGLAAERIGLSPEDRVLIANDKGKPKDWYLAKSPQSNAFKIRKAKSGSAVTFNNTGLCKKLLGSLGTKQLSVCFPVGAESLTTGMSANTWSILTKAID